MKRFAKCDSPTFFGREAAMGGEKFLISFLTASPRVQLGQNPEETW
jgi:hypothetical protein